MIGLTTGKIVYFTMSCLVAYKHKEAFQKYHSKVFQDLVFILRSVAKMLSDVTTSGPNFYCRSNYPKTMF